MMTNAISDDPAAAATDINTENNSSTTRRHRQNRSPPRLRSGSATGRRRAERLTSGTSTKSVDRTKIRRDKNRRQARAKDGLN